MNGLPSTDSGDDRTPAEALGREQLESILRSSSRDSKVTFGAHRGTFDLSKADVENFYHLVDQRVQEQNTVNFASSEFCIYYNDGSSRRFSGLLSFAEYAETRRRFPTVATIHLTYFLTFPGSVDPEKQEIDIVIRASESTSDTIDLVVKDDQLRMSGDKIQVTTSQDESGFGVITYTINHTSISWGLDLEGHIRGHIEGLLQEPTTVDIWLRKLSGPLNLVTTVFVGLYIVNLVIDGFFWFLYSTDGANDPTQITQIAAQYLINGHIAKYIVATIVVAIVIFVLFSGLVSRLTKTMRLPRPSFLTLDEGDMTRKTQRLRQFERRWIRVAALIAANVATGLAVAFLEDRVAVWFS